jgi:hypothetical protein
VWQKLQKVYVMPCEPVPGELGDRKVYLVKDEPEPKNHPALQISIARQDSLHWVSYSKRFRVDSLRLKEKLPGAEEEAPEHPFYRKFPDDNPELAFQVDSGPPRPESHDCVYEAHFKFEDGAEADPHIQINK